MPKVNNYILNTDFATLKNSQAGLTATVTVPGSTVIGASALAEWHVDIPITQTYAMAACRIASSKNSNRSLLGNATYMIRTATGGAVTYDVYCYVFRVNSTTVRFQAVIQNPYSLILTGEPGDEVFSLYMYTFVPPFA